MKRRRSARSWHSTSPAGAISALEIDPQEFGITRCRSSELLGGDAATNLTALIEVFEGRDRGAHRDALMLQCGLALHIAGRAQSIAAGIDAARKGIDSGAARSWLRQLQDFAANRSGTQGRPMSGFLDAMARSQRGAREAGCAAGIAGCTGAPRPGSAAERRRCACRRAGFDVIAELKLRSPAAGVLGCAERRLAAARGGVRTGGAAAVSVLTEPSRFDGSLRAFAAAPASGADAAGHTGDAQGFSARSVPGAGSAGRGGGRRAADPAHAVERPDLGTARCRRRTSHVRAAGSLRRRGSGNGAGCVGPARARGRSHGGCCPHRHQ